MPIKVEAFQCRGCGVLFRTLGEAEEHEAKCPEIAKEKERLHNLTRKDHEVPTISKPNPTEIRRMKSSS